MNQFSCQLMIGAAFSLIAAAGCDRKNSPDATAGAASQVKADVNAAAKVEPKAAPNPTCHEGHDPVCHMKTPIVDDDPKFVYEGKTYCFCNETDRDGFKKDPQKYLSPEWRQHPRMLSPEEVK